MLFLGTEDDGTFSKKMIVVYPTIEEKAKREVQPHEEH